MPIETFPIGPLETNCHIVISGSDAVAVDPGGDLNSGLGEVLALLKEQNLTLRAILCTHFTMHLLLRFALNPFIGSH
jgi:hydroxyacylglutathione hydrolase